MEKVWILLLESNKWRLLLHICLTSKARMSQTRRSQKCALIRASTIARLVGERRFQESDALRPDCRLVLVHLGYFPKLPKITFKILRRVYYEAINLIVSAIDQRFNQERFSSYAQMDPYGNFIG